MGRTREVTIVAFGDSLTFGYGIEEKYRWTNLLEEALGVKVINSGVCGNTSSEGLQRIVEDVLIYKPDYVIINFCMNDHFIKIDGSNEAKVSIRKFEENIIKMVSLVREIKATPILVAPHKIIEGDIGDGDGGKGATHYYRRHPYNLYKNIGGANNQLKRYCDKIVQIGKEYGVLTIDLYNLSETQNLYSITINNRNSGEDDGVHINKQGAKFYLEHILKAFKGLSIC